MTVIDNLSPCPMNRRERRPASARHALGRWQYREDRHDFKRWLLARSPAPRTFGWSVRDELGAFVLKMQRGERHFWRDIRLAELKNFSGGWRSLVALELRAMRAAFRRAETGARP